MKHQSGFTLIEMLVVLFIIGILTSMVMVNLRVSENANRIDGALRQLVGTFEEARIWSTSGRITNESFPANGYAVAFYALGPYPYTHNYDIRAINADSSYDVVSEISLPSSIGIKDVCVTKQADISSSPPCTAGVWTKLKPASGVVINYLPSGDFTIDAGLSSSPDNTYIGGMLYDQRSGRKAYFYFNYDTGVITSGRL